ncbi:GNAT family N-acetyltransferase [Butyrivibrio sp. YAB3001]|uniref:GNAT family N-acetyltransferase n=1 Tax=Butyrivibrio sp. YAB3001 TaxID=1520812 RepID=UPI0008F65AB4|nr:GNAT family N-acetyltransferase [Butyrivibrio sp. YAB3001]SFD11420.1 Acetyltransferase (GNAT) domain-containing protein [Butyrivibrio sp. YAB3001]
MNSIVLGDRTEETVRIYFEQAQKTSIKSMLPQKATTVEEAIADYHETLLPTATSYGKTILADGTYVGDIWCYCIDKTDTPNAMLSYCVFDESSWNKGIATSATLLFLKEIKNKYNLESIGAFTFSDNLASIKVLEKSGFELIETFEEDGRESKYYQIGL